MAFIRLKEGPMTLSKIKLEKLWLKVLNHEVKHRILIFSIASIYKTGQVIRNLSVAQILVMRFQFATYSLRYIILARHTGILMLRLEKFLRSSEIPNH